MQRVHGKPVPALTLTPLGKRQARELRQQADTRILHRRPTELIILLLRYRKTTKATPRFSGKYIGLRKVTRIIRG